MGNLQQQQQHISSQQLQVAVRQQLSRSITGELVAAAAAEVLASQHSKHLQQLLLLVCHTWPAIRVQGQLQHPCITARQATMCQV
jgi:hypothetical protein